MDTKEYRWKVGDVFVAGEHRWKVDAVYDDRAVLRSCGNSWATTVPLTFISSVLPPPRSNVLTNVNGAVTVITPAVCETVPLKSV